MQGVENYFWDADENEVIWRDFSSDFRSASRSRARKPLSILFTMLQQSTSASIALKSENSKSLEKPRDG